MRYILDFGLADQFTSGAIFNISNLLLAQYTGFKGPLDHSVFTVITLSLNVHHCLTVYQYHSVHPCLSVISAHVLQCTNTFHQYAHKTQSSVDYGVTILASCLDIQYYF